MDRYRVIKLIGDGTFGSVVQAEHVDDHRLVAIKRMKRTFDSWEECLSLREVKALKYLAHPNLVRLHEVVREHRVLHFVFEHLEMNLYQAVRHRHIQTVGDVRSILRQLLDGLIYMHSRGFAHRDMKPENILMSRRSGGGSGWLVKLADFGLAREIPDPDAVRGKDKLTEYVSTRWYRAPEVLLRCKDYDRQVDIWGLGTVAAEICTTRPLFPGRSEHDQLHRICLVLGCPNAPDAPGGYWAKGSTKAKSLGLIFQPTIPTPLPLALRGVHPQLIRLIGRFLRWDPNERITAVKALQDPFFTTSKSSSKSSSSPAPSPKVPSRALAQSSSLSSSPSANPSNQLDQVVPSPPPMKCPSSSSNDFSPEESHADSGESPFSLSPLPPELSLPSVKPASPIDPMGLVSTNSLADQEALERMIKSLPSLPHRSPLPKHDPKADTLAVLVHEKDHTSPKSPYPDLFPSTSLEQGLIDPESLHQLELSRVSPSPSGQPSSKGQYPPPLFPRNEEEGGEEEEKYEEGRERGRRRRKSSGVSLAVASKLWRRSFSRGSSTKASRSKSRGELGKDASSDKNDQVNEKREKGENGPRASKPPSPSSRSTPPSPTTALMEGLALHASHLKSHPNLLPLLPSQSVGSSNPSQAIDSSHPSHSIIPSPSSPIDKSQHHDPSFLSSLPSRGKSRGEAVKAALSSLTRSKSKKDPSSSIKLSFQHEEEGKGKDRRRKAGSTLPSTLLPSPSNPAAKQRRDSEETSQVPLSTTTTTTMAPTDLSGKIRRNLSFSSKKSKSLSVQPLPTPSPHLPGEERAHRDSDDRILTSTFHPTDQDQGMPVWDKIRQRARLIKSSRGVRGEGNEKGGGEFSSSKFFGKSFRSHRKSSIIAPPLPSKPREKRRTFHLGPANSFSSSKHDTPTQQDDLAGLAHLDQKDHTSYSYGMDVNAHDDEDDEEEEEDDDDESREKRLRGSQGGEAWASHRSLDLSRIFRRSRSRLNLSEQVRELEEAEERRRQFEALAAAMRREKQGHPPPPPPGARSSLHQVREEGGMEPQGTDHQIDWMGRRQREVEEEEAKQQRQEAQELADRKKRAMSAGTDVRRSVQVWVARGLDRVKSRGGGKREKTREGDTHEDGEGEEEQVIGLKDKEDDPDQSFATMDFSSSPSSPAKRGWKNFRQRKIKTVAGSDSHHPSLDPPNDQDIHPIPPLDQSLPELPQFSRLDDPIQWPSSSITTTAATAAASSTPTSGLSPSSSLRTTNGKPKRPTHRPPSLHTLSTSHSKRMSLHRPSSNLGGSEEGNGEVGDPHQGSDKVIRVGNTSVPPIPLYFTSDPRSSLSSKPGRISGQWEGLGYAQQPSQILVKEEEEAQEQESLGMSLKNPSSSSSSSVSVSSRPRTRGSALVSDWRSKGFKGAVRNLLSRG